MADPNTDHLDSEQIDLVLETNRDEKLGHVSAHLQHCAKCRAALCRHAIETGRLRLLENVEPAARQPTCPDDLQWAGVLAGILTAEETRRYLQHAMQCDACGVTLKQSAAALADDISEEDDRFLNSLHISTDVGRRALARRLAATQAPPPSVKRHGLLRWSPAFAVAAMAAFFMVWMYPAWEARRAQTIIAEQFQKGRPFEFRLDDVPYGPLTVTRGGEAGSQSSLPPFVYAAPGGWRANLLAGDASSVIDRLEKMRQAGDSSIAVLGDLAVAYAVRGDQLRSRNDYARSLELLRELLQRDAMHPSAWFNQALLFERLSQPDEMRTALEEFLRLEADPGWRSEAQTLLAR